MAKDYIIITDDSCDLPKEFYSENNVPVMSLSFNIDGNSYKGFDMSSKDFYAHIRSGKMPITSQINANEFVEIMEPYLQDGHDILYYAFTSGLSGTYNSGVLAAKDLSEKYPDRKIIVVDSLCASLGQGLLLYKILAKKKAGASIEELAEWIRQNRMHVSHNVVADDLHHLHRGGRVSKTSAIAGSLLGIKPIIHLNNEGKLIALSKVRGRKNALIKIVDRTAECVGKTPNDFFTVCHADCLEDAQFVADLASERFGIKDYLINFIGPVIGSHTGCGTVSLFMMAEHR